jgi:voltage-gated potassium channel Kch
VSAAERRTTRARAGARAADLEPLLLPAAAVAVWLLGYWGERSLTAEHVAPLDAAYRALQLFFMESGAEPGPIPWQIHVARILAPLVLGYAAVRGLLLLARGEAARWRARLLARSHVVVVGESPTAQAVAAEARASFPMAVLVGSESVRGSGGQALPAFPGPVTDELALAQARPDRARHVVVATGDDARNLEAMAAVQRAIARAPRRPVVHVELADGALWRELHGLALGTDGDRAPVEFFNLADREARVLLDAVADLIDGAGADVEVVVSVDERSELALVSHLARRRAAAGASARVTLLGDDAEAQRERLLESLPWLRDVARVATLDPDALDAEYGRLGRSPVVLILHAEAAPGLTRATLVARHVRDATVAVAVSDPAMRDALAAASLKLGAMRLVPTQADALGAALFGESAIELIARAKHDDYVARALAEGDSPRDNPSLVPWERLPESLRESNRLFARSVAAKLSEVGARIAPLRGSAEGELVLDDARLEELARSEHDRWMADLEAEGWRHTSGPKDAERKLHPLLVPWEQLSEPERDKDRDSYRALPVVLARAGYEVVPPERRD